MSEQSRHPHQAGLAQFKIKQLPLVTLPLRLSFYSKALIFPHSLQKLLTSMSVLFSLNSKTYMGSHLNSSRTRMFLELTP